MKIKTATILLTLLTMVQCGDKDGIEDKSSSYEKICIEGHVYFERDQWYWRKSMVSIKLTDDGKPVKCYK